MTALGAVLALVLLAPHPAGAAAGDGKAIYEQICAACHQANGQGVPGVYPPLAGHIGRFVRVPEGRRYLARVIAHGMFGPIRVEDRPYNGLMPPQPQLDDAEIAGVLNYVLAELSAQELPGDFAPLTAEEVAGYRVPQATPSQVRKEREAVLENLGGQRSAPPHEDGGRPGRDVRLAAGPVPRITGTAQDFARNCQGCHRADGMGALGAVPRLRAFVGHFTHLPEGRAFLARVPGVAFAMLDDARLASLLNWMLDTYSPGERAPGFAPYTAQEVGAFRREPIANAQSTRQRLIADLRVAGIVGEDDGLGALRDEDRPGFTSSGGHPVRSRLAGLSLRAGSRPSSWPPSGATRSGCSCSRSSTTWRTSCARWPC